MDFLNFITELEKAGNSHKQGQDQTKIIHSLLDDVYKVFFSFSFEQAEQIRNIVTSMKLKDVISNYPTEDLSIQKNTEEWLTKWLMSFVLCNGTGDYRDDIMMINTYLLKKLPRDFDRRPLFESATWLARGDVNDTTTLRGILASRAKKGFFEKLFGK